MRSAGSSRCRRRWPDAGSRCRPHTARTTCGLLMPVAYIPDGRNRHPASWGTGDPRTRSARGHQIRRPDLGVVADPRHPPSSGRGPTGGESLGLPPPSMPGGAWSPAPVPRPGVSAHTAHATPGSRMRVADISLAVAGFRAVGPQGRGPRLAGRPSRASTKLRGSQSRWSRGRGSQARRSPKPGFHPGPPPSPSSRRKRRICPQRAYPG